MSNVKYFFFQATPRGRVESYSNLKFLQVFNGVKIEKKMIILLSLFILSN